VVAGRKDTATPIHPFRNDPQLRVVERVVLGAADDVVADTRVVSYNARPIAEEPHLVVIVDIEAVLREPEAVVPIFNGDLEPHPPRERRVAQRFDHVAQTKLCWL
jgi:hypothetical protein